MQRAPGGLRYILHAAQLIGPAIEKDTAQGYEWLSRTLVRAGEGAAGKVLSGHGPFNCTTV